MLVNRVRTDTVSCEGLREKEIKADHILIRMEGLCFLLLERI